MGNVMDNISTLSWDTDLVLFPNLVHFYQVVGKAVTAITNFHCNTSTSSTCSSQSLRRLNHGIISK